MYAKWMNSSNLILRTGQGAWLDLFANVPFIGREA